MGIPVRLAVGPLGDHTIPLNVTSMDIAVDRNVSAFPTPNNVANRFGIDTNIPAVEIELAGILEDDLTIADGNTEADSSNAYMIMNFASVIPTSADVFLASPWVSGSRVSNRGDGNDTRFEVKPGQDFNISASSITVDVYDHYITAFDDASATLDAITGRKAYDKYGRVIGTINSVTFSDDGDEDDPEITIDKLNLSEAAVACDEGDPIYVGSVGTSTFIAERFINKEFVIFPDYWRTLNASSAASDYGMSFAVKIRFTSAVSSLAGGSAVPEVTQQAGWESQTVLGFAFQKMRDARIDIPIGNIFTVPDNGNPASTMATLLANALNLSTGDSLASNLTIRSPGHVHPDGSTGRPNEAFSAVASGPVVKITQLYDISKVSDNELLDDTLSIVDYGISGEKTFSRLPESLGYRRDNLSRINSAWQWEVISLEGQQVGFSKNKSAGDKVQDLLGIISNSSNNLDLVRGIQIPYDSLITSSAVTPIARNFFLTFGAQGIDFKGSLYNTKDASSHMTPSVPASNMGGEHNEWDNSEYTLFQRFIAGTLGDTAAGLLQFAGGLIRDTTVALTSEAHGNDGGMRIIPEKLHVRYDAGHNYYSFNLKLLASDFVIGV